MKSNILLCLCLLFLVSTAANATTVYKWDENGRTIYSQTPPPPGIKFVIVEKKIKTSTSVATADSASDGSTFEERQAERDQKKKEQEQLAESNKIKKENCAIARNNLDSLSSRGQVTIKENDIYRKLSEEERQQRIQETKSQIDEFCS